MSPSCPKTNFRVAVAFALLSCGAWCGEAIAAQPAQTQPQTQPMAGAASRPVKLKITISPQTTYVLGPMNADGTVDYLAAWNERMGKDVPAGRDAFVPLLEMIDPNQPPWSEPAVIASLRAGLPGERIVKPQRWQGYYFIYFRDFLRWHPPAQRTGASQPARAAAAEAVEQTESRNLEEAMRRPWSAKDYPTVAKWLEANDRPLGILTEASTLPRYYAPRVSHPGSEGRLLLTGTMLLVWRIALDFPRALVARAMLRFTGGNLSAARADLLAVHRWARLVAQDPDFAGRAEAGSIDRLACQAEQAMAASGKLTAAQATAMIQGLDGLQDIPGMADVMDRATRMELLEHLMAEAREGVEQTWWWGSRRAQESYEAMRRGEDPTTAPKFIPPRPRIALSEPNWDIALRTVNTLCDRQVAALSKPTYPARKAAADAFAAELTAANGGKDTGGLLDRIQDETRRAADGDRQMLDTAVRHVGELSFCMLGEIVYKCWHVVDADTMRLRLTKVSLALAAYRAQTGVYPRALEVLVPAYLPAVPADLFTEKPLVYKPAGGGYLLYSLGPNMTDDGGKELGSGGDDVVVRVGAAGGPAGK